MHPSSSCLYMQCVCVHMYSFAGLIRWMPQPTFSDAAITDRHSDTTIFQLREHWVQISWSIGSEKSFRTCAAGGSSTLNSLCEQRTPYPLGQGLRWSQLLLVLNFLILISIGALRALGNENYMYFAFNVAENMVEYTYSRTSVARTGLGP